MKLIPIQEASTVDCVQNALNFLSQLPDRLGLAYAAPIVEVREIYHIHLRWGTDSRYCIVCFHGRRQASVYRYEQGSGQWLFDEDADFEESWRWFTASESTHTYYKEG